MAKNGYDFYLDKCLLPIAPPKLQIKINNANETVTLINEGEVNILKTAGLTDIEFECRIPQEQYPFAVFILCNPLFAILIAELMNGKQFGNGGIESNDSE